MEAAMQAEMQRRNKLSRQQLCESVASVEPEGLDLDCGRLAPMRGADAAEWGELARAAGQRQRELGGAVFLEVRLSQNGLRAKDAAGAASLLQAIQAVSWWLHGNPWGRLGVAALLAQLGEAPPEGCEACVENLSLASTGADPRAFPPLPAGGGGLRRLQLLDLSNCPSALEAAGLAALVSWATALPALREVHLRSGTGEGSDSDSDEEFGPGALPHLRALERRGIRLPGIDLSTAKVVPANELEFVVVKRARR